ncbi:MAG TPA: TonB family protein [Steroidobacteraceae bacterium]|jgi:protein TonB
MSHTIHAFPPVDIFRSVRGWMMAAIVLLHAGFFWALSNGLSIGSLIDPKPPLVLTPIEPSKKQLPKPVDLNRLPPRIGELEPVAVPPPEPIAVVSQTAPLTTQVLTEPLPAPAQGAGSNEPVIVEPKIDPRIGLSTPAYPVSEIRAEHTGTVILSVEVLPNGRVGRVRIEQSSGYPRLDEAAAREARTWRLIPGTRDGTAVPMWKRIPIVFRLTD